MVAYHLWLMRWVSIVTTFHSYRRRVPITPLQFRFNNEPVPGFSPNTACLLLQVDHHSSVSSCLLHKRQRLVQDLSEFQSMKLPRSKFKQVRRTRNPRYEFAILKATTFPSRFHEADKMRRSTSLHTHRNV
ncbi:hypothetical protein COOONC_05996 [Cooperia oncophora]